MSKDDPGEDSVEKLIDRLRADERTAVYAARRLICRGEAALPSMLKALGDGDVEVRRKVVWPLWIIGSPRATDALIAALEHDPDVKVRRYAAYALGEIKHPKAINPLIWAFKDTDARVRWDAAVALAKIGATAIESLVVALQYGDEAVRLGAVTALGWMRDSNLIESLTLALRDKDEVVRTRAAFALGWTNDPRAVEPLIDALKDRSDEVRMQAAVGLGWLRDARAVEPLIALLGDDRSDWVAYAATEALSYIGGDLALKALRFAARYSLNLQVRQAARVNLERLGLNPDHIAPDTPSPPHPQRLWGESSRRCNLVITPKV